MSSGFGEYCSLSCKSSDTIDKINSDPTIVEKTALLSSKRMSALHKDPSFASGHTERSSERLKILNIEKNKERGDFRSSHQGMSPTEWLLWTNPEFQKLSPIPQDTRFFHSHHGGIKMDFSIFTEKLCIELDGWKHDPEKDKQRDRWLLETHGWKTIRFSNKQIKTELLIVIERIYYELKLQRTFNAS